MNNLKVLIAENDTKILFAFDKILEAEGYICIKTASVTEALKEIQQKKPNGIFLDISRSEQEYDKIFEQLLKKHLKTPIILITSHITDEIRDLAGKIGALGIYEKPLTLSMIREGLHKIKAKVN